MVCQTQFVFAFVWPLLFSSKSARTPVWSKIHHVFHAHWVPTMQAYRLLRKNCEVGQFLASHDLVSLVCLHRNICPRQCQITARLGRDPVRTRRQFVNYGGWDTTQINPVTDKKKFLLLPSLLIIRENFRFLFLISPDTRTARAQHVTKRKRIAIVLRWMW